MGKKQKKFPVHGSFRQSNRDSKGLKHFGMKRLEHFGISKGKGAGVKMLMQPVAGYGYFLESPIILAN